MSSSKKDSIKNKRIKMKRQCRYCYMSSNQPDDKVKERFFRPAYGKEKPNEKE